MTLMEGRGHKRGLESVLRKSFCSTGDDQYVLQTLPPESSDRVCVGGKCKETGTVSLAPLLHITTNGISRKKEKISFQTEFSI